MSPSVGSDSVPNGFVRLPVYADGQLIPGASPRGVLGPNGIRAFRHLGSAVRFIIFSAPGPLVSATIVVGTEPVSHAGHPHTLEHIIFLGSQNHPQRGYLDNLACRSLSDGTNAWTETEHTAYTAKTAGLDGLLNLLPCYLDHVLRPVINRPAFDSEVYRILPDGKEAGVVFCEMQARENTEIDIQDHVLRSILFEGTPLAFNAGGLCQDIRKLTNEDIARFHREQYCGANVSVVIGGSNISSQLLLSSVKPLLDEIAADPNFDPGTPRWRTPLQLQPLPPNTRKNVKFPSPDLSIGTVTLAWRGPSCLYAEDCIVIGILLRYLAEDLWSPLRQRYVEVEEQLASDVYGSQESFMSGSFHEISFQGVDHHGEEEEVDDDDDEGDDDDDDDSDDNDDNSDRGEKHKSSGDPSDLDSTEEGHDQESYLLSGQLEADVMNYLNEICSSGQLPGGISAVNVALRKEREDMLFALESGSHSAVPDHLLDELVYDSNNTFIIGKELRSFPAIFNSLGTKDESFWLSSLKRFFIDAPRVELVMVPDEALAEELAEADRKALNDRVEDLGKGFLEKMGRESEERIATLKPIQFKAESFPPIPSTMTISRFPYHVIQQQRDCFILQSVKLETDFVSCQIYLDTKRLNFEQRMWLDMLSELIPTCDVLLDDGSYIPYTDNSRALCEAVIGDEAGAAMGEGSKAHQSLIFRFAATPECFEEATDVMLRTLFQCEVTPERVAAICQTSSAEITSKMRDAESVLSTCMVVIPYIMGKWKKKDHLPNFVLYSFLGASPLVSFLCEEFAKENGKKKVKEGIVKKITGTLRALRGLSAKDTFIQITAQEPEKASQTVERLWLEKKSKFGSSGIESLSPIVCENGFSADNADLPISRRVYGSLDKLFRGQGTVAKVIGIAGVESSFLEVHVDSEIYVGHSDWSALFVLMEMLCRIEGPLSDAVRGAGLAYGVDLHNNMWQGRLELSIFDSSSLAHAWEAVCDCLDNYGRSLDESNEQSMLEVELDTAKASVLFKLSRGRSSPKSIGNGVLSQSGMGAPTSPSADQALEEEVERVTLRCVKRVFEAHVKRLYTSTEGRLAVVVCGQASVEETIQTFNECRWPLEMNICSIEELYPKQVQQFVKTLRKK